MILSHSRLEIRLSSEKSKKKKALVFGSDKIFGDFPA
jgi:hypothetical protein